MKKKIEEEIKIEQEIDLLPLNNQCLNCHKECKQFEHIKIIKCPHFDPIESEEARFYIDYYKKSQPGSNAEEKSVNNHNTNNDNKIQKSKKLI